MTADESKSRQTLSRWFFPCKLFFLHKNQIRNVFFTSRAYVGSEKYAIKYREGKLGERETLNWMQRDASAPVICDYNKTAFAALLI